MALFTSSNSRIPKYLKNPLLISLLLGMVMSLLSVTLIFTLQPVIPVLYSLGEPSQYLVSKYWIFLFPVISYLVTLFHLILLLWLKEYEKLLSRLFAWTTVTVQLLILLAMIRIILVVT